jgi:hypothetical protein
MLCSFLERIAGEELVNKIIYPDWFFPQEILLPRLGAEVLPPLAEGVNRGSA